MILYTLLAGKSKKKMKRIETNSKKKCENYRDALIASKVSQYKHFEIREALPDEDLKEHKSSNQWTNYNVGGPKVIKRGKKQNDYYKKD